MRFDFDKWLGVIHKDNRVDDYYSPGERCMYCDECDNLMVPLGDGRYKCTVCGCEEGSVIF